MACKEGEAYASAFPMNSKRFLKLSGYFSLFFGLFHVPFLFLGEEAARFFSAPPYVRAMIREHSPWLWLVVVVILGVFGLFGAYALSAAGVIRRRLPALRGVLRVIACIYTLRGLVIIPQLVSLARYPAAVPLQTLVFSGVALMVGVFFWLGLREVDLASPEAVDGA